MKPEISTGTLTKPEAALLLENISSQWLREASQFALATGARANEIFSLTWDKVDLNRSMAWVTQDLSKSGKSRPMPLNAEALSLLEIRKDAGTEYCFTRPSGRRITQIDRRCFERAVKAAGLKKLKFHDLRHTWASWHVQSGTPLMILKELGGWETIEMVQKYAHLDVGHLAQYVTASQIQSRFSHAGESENKKAA